MIGASKVGIVNTSGGAAARSDSACPVYDTCMHPWRLSCRLQNITRRSRQTPLYLHLYVQVLVAIAAGVLLGIDRFMSECRALTKLIGNAVATMVVAKSEGELFRAQLAAALAGNASDQTGGCQASGVVALRTDDRCFYTTYFADRAHFLAARSWAACLVTTVAFSLKS